MRILPVLDILRGQVVRGVAGRRAEYRPIVSSLTAASAPMPVAAAFRRHFGCTQLYLADLDAIAGQPPALAMYRRLHQDGFHLWVDAGTASAADALIVAAAGVDVVAGLETLAGPTALAEVVRVLGPGRVVFSLDLKAGQLLVRNDLWPTADSWELAQLAVEQWGVRRLLVLDLARVGIGQGTGTEALCTRLVNQYPDLELAAGGGVRGSADLERLEAAGVQVALVASALHDGRLTKADCVPWLS